MKKIMAVALGVILIAAACNRKGVDTQLNNPSVDNRTLTVQFDDENNSKELGTARLKAEGNQVRVNIDVGNFPKDTPQPSHIHTGTCETLGGVKFTLNPVVNGKSETLVDTSLTDLISSLPLAINIHKSEAEASIYYACGDVSTEEKKITPTPAPTPTTDQNKSQQIIMNASGFAPASITVKKGTKVTFVNNDSRVHWPASDPHPVHTDLAGFDAGKGIPQGGSYTYTFGKIGTWTYHDHLNPTLKGKVIVIE